MTPPPPTRCSPSSNYLLMILNFTHNLISPNNRSTLQDDLNKLSEWTQHWEIHFNNDKSTKLCTLAKVIMKHHTP